MRIFVIFAAFYENILQVGTLGKGLSMQVLDVMLQKSQEIWYRSMIWIINEHMNN